MRISPSNTARSLMNDANAMWELRIGPHNNYSGFQVDVVGIDELTGEPLFKSMLYGGRSMTGTARQVRWSQVAYIRSKRPAKR